MSSHALYPQNPRLWWPHGMSPQPGYLYELTVSVTSAASSDELSDVYRLRVGLRDLAWNGTGIFVNHRRFYFRGFGKHEDADIRSVFFFSIDGFCFPHLLPTILLLWLVLDVLYFQETRKGFVSSLLFLKKKYFLIQRVHLFFV